MSFEEQVEDRGHKPQSYSALVICFHVMMHALRKTPHLRVQAMRVLWPENKVASSVLLYAPIGDPCWWVKRAKRADRRQLSPSIIAVIWRTDHTQPVVYGKVLSWKDFKLAIQARRVCSPDSPRAKGCLHVLSKNNAISKVKLFLRRFLNFHLLHKILDALPWTSQLRSVADCQVSFAFHHSTALNYWPLIAPSFT